MKRSIVWFRNDLRIHDNEALLDALSHNDEIIPLYVEDPRLLRGKTPLGFDKMGKFRRKFLQESLTDLRRNLQELGSNLYVRQGHPESIIPEIARECKTNYIYCNRERTREEVEVQDRLENKMWSIGQEIRYFRGKMLYYTADLPFPVTHCPDVFTSFRKEVEKFVNIRAPLLRPEKIVPLSIDLDLGEISSISADNSDIQTLSFLRGGETQALKELQYYLWDSNLIANYKETRNSLFGRDYSSKFSAHLSKGTLSPKLIYSEIKKFEDQVTKNKSTYWLVFELLWRDFFRFMAKKHGDKIFRITGTRDVEPAQYYENRTLFDKWSSGKTGIPFIDANMRELNATGFMSNRGRQNVASFLVKDMQLNWLWGAEYFESMLIDYDPCSNYGNWNYIAGVGSDAREDRYFNIPLQAKKYDHKGEYMREWIPELKDAPLNFLFDPFSEKLDSSKFDYPQPCINFRKKAFV